MIKYFFTGVLLIVIQVAYAQSVQFELNPAFGITGGSVATGQPRTVKNGTGDGDAGPFPGAFSLTTALNFKLKKTNFFPSWGFRIGIYGISVSNYSNTQYPYDSEITFVNFGMPVYLNYIYNVNKTLSLRASAGGEALVEMGAPTPSFAAEGVGGIVLVNRISIGVKYYQMIGNYRSGANEYNLHSWMLDFKFRNGGW